MKNLILIAVAALIATIVVIKALPIEKERTRRLRRFWDRACTGIEWRRRFPDVPKEDIRKFLDAFVDGFAFKTSQRLKFAPDDKVMDVYRSLYPESGWPDALEVETFALILGKEYNFDLSKVDDPDITLGQLFAMIRAPTTG